MKHKSIGKQIILLLFSSCLLNCGTSLKIPRSYHFQPIVSQKAGKAKASLALSTETEVPLANNNTTPKNQIKSDWSSTGNVGFIRLDGRLDYAFSDDFELYYNEGSRSVTGYGGARIGFHPDSFCNHLALDFIASPKLTKTDETKSIDESISATATSSVFLLGSAITMGWNIDSKRLFYTSIAYVNYKSDLNIKQKGALVDEFNFKDVGNQIMMTPGIRIQDSNIGFSFELGYNQIQWSRHDTVKKEASAAFILDSEFF
jgi:hypothetical protein